MERRIDMFGSLTLPCFRLFFREGEGSLVFTEYAWYSGHRGYRGYIEVQRAKSHSGQGLGLSVFVPILLRSQTRKIFGDFLDTL